MPFLFFPDNVVLKTVLRLSGLFFTRWEAV
jgi:hypothetical protein